MMEREGREGKGARRSSSNVLFQALFSTCFATSVNILSLEFPLLKVPCHPHVGCTSNYYDSLAS
jgi:hypothetical protein